MAPVSRRPATRHNPSSTQEENIPTMLRPNYKDVDKDNTEEFPPLSLDGDEHNDNVFTQVEDGTYRPQHDNPSNVFPGDKNDIDTALENYTSSQTQHGEFTLTIESSSDEEEEEEDSSEQVNNNVPLCTQGTLDVASILVGGFNNSTTTVDAQTNSASIANNNSAGHSAAQNQSTVESSLASSIAAQLHTHGLANTHLDDAEIKFIEECDEGKNKKQYDESQIRYEKRFFDAVAKFGGDLLSPLATNFIANPWDLQEHQRVDYSFYAVVGGEKTADKHAILNRCFTLCGIKWHCLSGPNKGKRVQPGSFFKMMQCLTYRFNKKGVKYTFDGDFNSKGEFHGIMKKLWREERLKDPSFGTGKNRARVDSSLVRKFIQAIREKNVRPYDDPEHCLICVIFILGYYCGLRGSSEHIDLDSANCFLGEYQVEDGPELAGLKWGGVKVPFSKTNQLKLNNTRLPNDEEVLLTFVEEPDHDCFDPYSVFCHYVAHCHPQAKKFYGRIVKQGDKLEGGRLKKECGRPIWFAESGHGRANWNLGPTKHRALCKQIAKLSGVEKWEQCTGHALRALCITHCVGVNLTAVDIAAKVRQKSVNSQKDYATKCSSRKANRVLAMTAVNENKKPASSSVDIQEVHPEAIITETQPMLPENRNKFLHASKKRRLDPVVEEEKENAIAIAQNGNSNTDLDAQLEFLKKQNEILRLQQENKRIQEELSGPSRPAALSPIPRCHGRGHSHPPTSHREHPPFQDLSPQNIRGEECRRSYPPTNYYPSRSPPRYYDDHRRGHGRYYNDQFGHYQGGYHRR